MYRNISWENNALQYDKRLNGLKVNLSWSGNFSFISARLSPFHFFGENLKDLMFLDNSFLSELRLKFRSWRNYVKKYFNPMKWWNYAERQFLVINNGVNFRKFLRSNLCVEILALFTPKCWCFWKSVIDVKKWLDCANYFYRISSFLLSFSTPIGILQSTNSLFWILNYLLAWDFW